MNALKKVLRIYAWLIVVFLLFMSFDVWWMNGTVLDKLLGFVIHVSPGLFLALILYFLKNKPYFLGLSLVTLSIVFMVLFNPFNNISELWFTFVFIIAPIFTLGLINLIAHYKKY